MKPYFLPLNQGLCSTDPHEILMFLIEHLNNAATLNEDDLRKKWAVKAFSDSVDELLDENGDLIEENGPKYREKIEKGIQMLDYYAGDDMEFGVAWNDLSLYGYSPAVQRYM